jgi:hypothetical protein
MGLALLLGAGTSSAQKIYKYIDKDGNTIYSQRAPIGVNAQEINPRIRTVTPEEAKAALKRLGDRANSTTQDRKDAQQQVADEVEANKRNEENCEKTKKNLDILNNSARVQSTSSDGSLTYLTDKEKQRRLKQAQVQVSSFCK